jgi:hypothetical protein
VTVMKAGCSVHKDLSQISNCYAVILDVQRCPTFHSSQPPTRVEGQLELSKH